MSYLFKVALKNISRNKSIVYTVGFFVASGVTVFSSSDNLSSNLNKGFEDINFDSNPHDLILTNKSFKPSQSLDMEPKYEFSGKTKLRVGYGLRWAFYSNYDRDYYIEDQKGKQKAESTLLVPHHMLACVAPSSFVALNNSELVFFDRNKALLGDHDMNKLLNSGEQKKTVPSKWLRDVNFLVKCNGQIVTKWDFNYTSNYFHLIANDWYKSLDSNTTTNDTSAGNKTEEDKKITKKVKANFHSDISFNPQKFLQKYNPTDQKYTYRKILERDFYLPFSLDFSNLVGGAEISGKYRKLVSDIKKSPIYYQLDSATRTGIDMFQNKKIFDKLESHFSINSLVSVATTFTDFIPMVKGLTYKQSLIMLIKLLIGDTLISKNENETFELDQLVSTKEAIKSKLEKLDDTSIRDLEDWEIIKISTDKEKKLDKLEDYIFSVILSKQKLSEITAEDDKGDWEQFNKNDDKNKTLCGNSACKYTEPDTNSTLAKAWISTMKKWVKDEYYDSNDNSRKEKEVLPAFDKLSKQNKDKDKDNVFGQNKSYRIVPTSFDTVYEALKKAIIENIKSYFMFLSANALKEVKRFVSEHDIFTLSFLLYNFKYSPESLGVRRDDDDFSLSLAYNKSVVIPNSTSSLAKLNDPNSTFHSFKVISKEVKDNSSLNRLKILEGNELPRSPVDYLEVMTSFMGSSTDDTRSLFTYKDFYNILSRAKFSDAQLDKLWSEIYRYSSSTINDTWSEGHFFSFNEEKILAEALKEFEFKEGSFTIKGSRIIFQLDKFKDVKFFRTINISAFINVGTVYGYLDQFSSYFTLVSPAYAKHNNIRPIGDEQYARFRDLVESTETSQEQWELEYNKFLLNPENHDHIVNVNGNRMIVTGIALSPDYLLPSLSWLNLIPDPSKEALLYVDDNGFRNISHNSLSSFDEYYLSVTYPQAVKDLGLESDYYQKLYQYINKFFRDNVDVDKNPIIDNPFFNIRKVSEPALNSLVLLRSSYVDNFTDSVNLISYILLIFIGLIIFFTCSNFIKKYINSSLKTFGIFMANGVEKYQIIFASFILIMVPTVVGTILGYFAGLALQPFVYGIFTDIWYLSPVFSGFNFSKLVSYILSSSGIMFTIAFLAAIRLLRPSVSNLLKHNVMFKENGFTRLLYSSLQGVNSLWKFRLSVIFNALNRAMVLSFSAIFLFLFSSFLFNNMGKFAEVADAEFKTKKYGFDMELETPTAQSGQYFLTNYNNLGNLHVNRMPSDRTIIGEVDDKNKFVITKISKDNPEYISTSINSPVLKNYLNDYLNDKKGANGSDKTFTESAMKHLKLVDLDYPARLTHENGYDNYLLQSKYEKNEKKLSTLTLLNTNNNANKVFYASTDNMRKNAKFNPPMDDGNTQNFNLLKYVPLKDEKIKATESNGGSSGSSDHKKEYEKYGSEPLFEPLRKYYQGKKPDNSFTKTKEVKKSESEKYYGYSLLGEDGDEDNDFVEVDDKHFPTLSRLYKDHSNYWLFNYSDIFASKHNPTFLKNRVIIPFLFDHDFVFNYFGQQVEINLWKEFDDFFAKYSPELVAFVKSNTRQFITKLIRSRYGSYFVNRFMTKHKFATEGGGNSGTPAVDNGENYNGRKTWNIKKSIMDSKLQDEVDEGLYYLDPSKIIYFTSKLTGDFSEGQDQLNHPDILIIFRPDFLYLFYALMRDPKFQTRDSALVKITFNNNVYVADYTKEFTENWSVTGDKSQDSKYGLVSGDDSITDSDYAKDPNGDQSYTYVRGDFPDKDIQDIRIIGLKQDKRGSYLKLYKDNRQINSKLYENLGDNIYPIIINRYTARRLNLGVDSTVKFRALNTFDRFSNQLSNRVKYKEVTLKVIDIFDSYYQMSLFMSQKNANKILGLDEDYGFNGIFTKRFDGQNDFPLQLTHVITGYSPSGFYSKHIINRTSQEFIKFLENKTHNSSNIAKFPNPRNMDLYLARSGITSAEDVKKWSGESLASEMHQMYGPSFTVKPIVKGIDNASKSNDLFFNVVSDLMISIINLFFAVSFPLLLWASVIVSNLFLEDLKNLLTILNLLGFSYWENSITVLLFLGLILAISTILAIPLSSSLLGYYVQGIFKAVSIYLPVYLRPEYVACSFLMLLGIFSFAFSRSLRQLKGLYLPLAVKTLVE